MNYIRCSTTWGTGSGRRRRLGTWSSWSGWWTRCVWGRVRCRRRRGSVRRRGESRRRRSLCAPPHPLRPAGYAPPFLNSFPGPLPLRPAARSAPRCSLLEPGSSSPARVSPGPRACGAAEARPSPYPSQIWVRTLTVEARPSPSRAAATAPRPHQQGKGKPGTREGSSASPRRVGDTEFHSFSGSVSVVTHEKRQACRRGDGAAGPCRRPC